MVESWLNQRTGLPVPVELCTALHSCAGLHSRLGGVGAVAPDPAAAASLPVGTPTVRLRGCLQEGRLCTGNTPRENTSCATMESWQRRTYHSEGMPDVAPLSVPTTLSTLLLDGLTHCPATECALQ
jgi:hypothetical protein